jgi:Cysteine rich repeat
MSSRQTERGFSYDSPAVVLVFGCAEGNDMNNTKGGRNMRRTMVLLLSLGLALLFVGEIFAAEKGPVETVMEGCKKEFETYCKEVTPGEGRLLACLYAYEDKLSARCEYSLYDAAAQLDRAIAALSYVANECKDDLKAYCSSIQPGEGRLASCMDRNEKKLSGRCKQALKDVGIKK